MPDRRDLLKSLFPFLATLRHAIEETGQTPPQWLIDATPENPPSGEATGDLSATDRTTVRQSHQDAYGLTPPP